MSTYLSPLDIKTLNPQLGQPYNVVSVSGGKDSTALLLLAIERKTTNIIVVFADTGNEHPITYEYIDYLEQALGIKIQRVKANFTQQIIKKRKFVEEKWFDSLVYSTLGYWQITEDDKQWVAPKKGFSPDQAQEIIERALVVMQPTNNPFLDLCIWKNRFPSTKARFCSEELKKNPIMDQVIYPALEGNEDVISWMGVRADESESRARLTENEYVMTSSTGAELWNHRPILQWSAQDCFDMHKRHGIKHNPLYEQGMGRVGCMPCIHARKAELLEIAKRFPAEIERIAEWESIVAQVSKHQSATFFTSDQRGHGIHALVEWAKTARGGSQYDLLNFDDSSSCSSIYGLCE